MFTNLRLNNGFGMVSNTVMRDPELSLGEKAVYAYLATYADNLTNETFISISRIASETGIGYSTIRRHIKNLEFKKVIKRYGRGSRQTTITILLK